MRVNLCALLRHTSVGSLDDLVQILRRKCLYSLPYHTSLVSQNDQGQIAMPRDHPQRLFYTSPVSCTGRVHIPTTMISCALHYHIYSLSKSDQGYSTTRVDFPHLLFYTSLVS